MQLTCIVRCTNEFSPIFIILKNFINILMLYSSIVLALNINNVTTEMVTVILFLNRESIFFSQTATVAKWIQKFE